MVDQHIKAVFILQEQSFIDDYVRSEWGIKGPGNSQLMHYGIISVAGYDDIKQGKLYE